MRFANRIIIFFLALYFGTMTCVYAQDPCPLATASEDIKCPASTRSMGTQTEIGTTYTWYKSGVIKRGPLSGDGTAVSFDFAINTPADAGHYWIEKNANGIIGCAQNVNVVFISPALTQTLTGGGYLCNFQKVLSLSGSEANASYELLLNNSPTGTIIPGTGNAINFPVVTDPGTYSVAAYNNGCPDSRVFFGNEVVIDALPPATINYTTTTTANITTGVSGTYLIEYGLDGFTPGTGAGAGAGGTLITANTSTVTINLPAAGTNYVVYTRQLCSPGQYTNSYGSYFTTSCNAITVFPYNEGFETTTSNQLPSCWKIYDNDLDGYYWQSNTSAPRTGARHAYLSTNFSIPTHNDFIVLPPMTLNGNQRIKYWVRSSNAGNPQEYQLRISTTNDGVAAFSTVLLTETISTPALLGTYEQKIINLTGYTGTVYLALSVLPTASTALELYIDDITVENIPSCPGPALLKTTSTTNNSANVSWAGTGTFILEYGPANFTPGTGATAGAGGTVVSNVTSPYTITGLNAGTAYDFYIRQNCTASSNGFSVNSPKVNFTTFLNCATATNITACTNVNVSVGAGNGVVDFEGLYPDNSAGSLTQGKEVLYTFTPATTGVYYLDVTALSTGLSYLYKPVSAGCGNTGWIGIANIYSIGKYPIGILQSGIQYYIILDNPGTSARTQSFKVCLATVNTPSVVNDCVGANSSGAYIPKNSSKTEYVIDNAGNLIAALDFSASPATVGNIFAKYYVNTNAVKHDTTGKEYLDRSFTISANDGIGPVGVKLYFTNNELTRLINEPNDGIADVSSINDLNVTTNKDVLCITPNSGSTSLLLPQTGNGTYDANSKYIQFTSPLLSSFYIHGGSNTLFNEKSICPGANTTFSMQNLGAGYTYQWQVDFGTGFVNIINSDIYKDAATNTLSLGNPPTEFARLKYRCVATKGANIITTEPMVLKFVMKWTGASDTSWENSSNWSCGATPGTDMDLIIPPGLARYPIVQSNVSCRSVTVAQGASVTVATGFKLTITGK